MNRRDVVAALIGAAVAVAIMLVIDEGKVRVSHAEQAVKAGSGAPSATVRMAPPVVRTPDAAPAKTEAQLRDRLAELEKERALLERELTSAYDAVGKAAYDLTTDDWAKLAERGEFKYQLPCFREGGFRPSEEQLKKLGLEASAGDVIQKAYASSNRRFFEGMQPICSEVLGVPADSIAMEKCIPTLFQKIYTGSARTTFSQVAEIRAGRRPESEATTPEMKMLLVFSGGMGPFEAELAKVFGADEAHRLAYSDDLCFQAQSL